MAIKPAGSAQKIRVGRVSGNTAIFFLPNISYIFKIFMMILVLQLFDLVKSGVITSIPIL